MKAILLVHRCCSMPICLGLLGFAALINLVAGNRQTVRELWAVCLEALDTIFQKGGTPSE